MIRSRTAGYVSANTSWALGRCWLREVISRCTRALNSRTHSFTRFRHWPDFDFTLCEGMQPSGPSPWMIIFLAPNLYSLCEFNRSILCGKTVLFQVMPWIRVAFYWFTFLILYIFHIEREKLEDRDEALAEQKDGEFTISCFSKVEASSATNSSWVYCWPSGRKGCKKLFT